MISKLIPWCAGLAVSLTSLLAQAGLLPGPIVETDWLAANAVEEDAFIDEFGSDLATESRAAARALYTHAEQVLSSIPHALGGGAAVAVTAAR